ncbi:MAG TPA: hypothetical protein VNA24_37390 [Hyalangium sp.]|nr:hypothetical protein [Hyalangium sp.]
MMKSFTARWGLILGLFLAPVASAQDAHYWTQQFGNRAWLLGGAFVGNPDDISAVYYNPGAIALLDSPELELTGSVYELTRLRVENGLGPGRDITLTRTDALPSLIAGSAQFGFLGKSKLAYSLITRQSFSFRLESRETIPGAELESLPGLDQLAADASLDENVGEYWAGLTWAYPLGEHLGVGITGFGAWRDHETRTQVLAQGFGSDGRTLLATLGRDFNLHHVRLLAKLGLSYQNGPWAAGLAVTTPSLAIWGTAQAGYERAMNEQGFELTSIPTPVFNFQDSLSPEFRSPWSLALGISRSLGDFTLHLAAEGFARQTPFKLIDSDPFSPQGSPEVIDPDFYFGLAPVINVALGAEQRLGEKVRAYVSAHTDFSAVTQTPDRNALLAGWDIYHLSFGVHFTAGRSRITVGTNVAMGAQNTTRIDEAFAEAGLPMPAGDQRIRFFQGTLIIGASFELSEQKESAGEPGEPDDTQASARSQTWSHVSPVR